MLTQLHYTVSVNLIQEAMNNIQSDEFRVAINQPTGNFFYDPWVIKPEYQNTVWEKLYNSLPLANKGESRIIHLRGGTCYNSHADIDNRYHLNLSGDKCYLIDLDNNNMHPISCDGIWYNMDAGRRHAAANFGNRPRYQLVVRHLLQHGIIADPVNVTIKAKPAVNAEDARFVFDEVISPMINKVNKQGLLDEFVFKDSVVSFTIDRFHMQQLIEILPNELNLL